MLTTVTSVTIGLSLVNNIKPGKTSLENTNRLRYEIWAHSEGMESNGKNELKNADPAVVSAIEKSLSEEKSSSDYQKMMSKNEEAKKRDPGPLQPFVDGSENLVKSFQVVSLLQVSFRAIFRIALSMLQNKNLKGYMNFLMEWERCSSKW